MIINYEDKIRGVPGQRLNVGPGHSSTPEVDESVETSHWGFDLPEKKRSKGFVERFFQELERSRELVENLEG